MSRNRENKKNKNTETTKDVFDDNIYLEGMKILINNSIDSL